MEGASSGRWRVALPGRICGERRHRSWPPSETVRPGPFCQPTPDGGQGPRTAAPGRLGWLTPLPCPLLAAPPRLPGPASPTAPVGTRRAGLTRGSALRQMRHAPASFQCEWIEWSSHVAATVCKSPRLLCSSPAAAPCTWPLLRSNHSGAPQGLGAPPQPGLLPRLQPAQRVLRPGLRRASAGCSVPGPERGSQRAIAGCSGGARLALGMTPAAWKGRGPGGPETPCGFCRTPNNPGFIRG
ncbi:PREDICTED: translation initiation factor IF-2-like [Chinchilla lanigera]|uniref:translation initiation factor IF-2-like n=1 Tax=Chinchilla lanigera TaxID=34839 RepID=UPI00038EFACC|nr:PREDICTED: translation initiation factor IF-2-like [Chinchilla lanigera]